MKTQFAVYAGAAVLVALALLWWRRSELRGIALMSQTPTTRAKNVTMLAPGSAVEIKGTLRCSHPVVAEFSQKSSAWFTSDIFERTITRTADSNGNQREETQSRAVHENCQFAPCTVEDESGHVALKLDGAAIEGETVIDRTELAGGEVAGTLMQVLGTNRMERHHTEKILPCDVHVYVLGEVQADHSVGKPAMGSKNRDFIVSLKSEEERSADTASFAKWLLISAGALIAIAAGLLYWGSR